MTSSVKELKSGKAIKMTIDIFSIKEIDNGYIVTLEDRDRVQIFVETYVDALSEIARRLLTLKREATKPPKKTDHEEGHE
jgi:hypothetical protein